MVVAMVVSGPMQFESMDAGRCAARSGPHLPGTTDECPAASGPDPAPASALPRLLEEELGSSCGGGVREADLALSSATFSSTWWV
jgi:hypothetical protein